MSDLQYSSAIAHSVEITCHLMSLHLTSDSAIESYLQSISFPPLLHRLVIDVL